MKKAFILFSLTLFLSTFYSTVHAKYDVRAIERRVNYLAHKMKSSNSAVRLTAMRKLMKIRHKKAVKPLSKALNDKSSFVRKMACKALANLKYPNAVKALVRRLKIEKNHFVKKELIIALGELKDERGRSSIKRFLKHPSVSLSKAAKQALAKLDAK